VIVQAVIPDGVRRFVLRSIPSAPFLEAALFFQRASANTHTQIDVAPSFDETEHSLKRLLRSALSVL
jgi:hypothetical protein